MRLTNLFNSSVAVTPTSKANASYVRRAGRLRAGDRFEKMSCLTQSNRGRNRARREAKYTEIGKNSVVLPLPGSKIVAAWLVGVGESGEGVAVRSKNGTVHEQWLVNARQGIALRLRPLAYHISRMLIHM